MQVRIYFLLFVITTVNQAFVDIFECADDTPWPTKDGIYLLFDFVHILKKSSFQMEILFKLQDGVISWLQANGGKHFSEAYRETEGIDMQ